MTRKPRNHWRDFGNVRREISRFVAKRGVPGRMPTITELRRAGQGSLVVAIHNYHGDFHEVAQRLDLSVVHKPKGYWKEFENVKHEILAFVAKEGVSGKMPAIMDLRKAGYASLVCAIHEYHGGWPEVAKRLDLSLGQRPTGYWKDFDNVRREILAFIADRGVAGMMPTESEFRGAGYASLTSAIYQYHSSLCEVAQRLDLATRRGRRSRPPEVAHERTD